MPTTKFWAERAAELRADAANLPEGLEQELKLSQAEQLEAAIVMHDMLAAPKPRKPV